MDLLHKATQKAIKDVKESFSFGPRDSRKIAPFNLKIFNLAIPAIIMGHYLDRIVDSLKKRKLLGEHALHYVIVQILIGGVLIYLLSITYRPFTDEFQTTIPGLFFGSLFFNMQPNLLSNMTETLDSIYRV